MEDNFSQDFGPFEGEIWLNCSHQGPLPRVAVEEAHEAIMWKITPHILKNEYFSEVPMRMKYALGKLINTPAEDIILGNSASYGLHLLANGIPWQAGDEVLLFEGDFPSDILPWLALEKKGVHVRLVKPRNHVLEADELQALITPATKLFCSTWVHSFSGCAVNAQALGEICRANNIIFVLNCSQALGTRPLNILNTSIDAITNVGFKWLCGPYGTGFCWIRPELRESLEYNQAYWLTMQTADDLGNKDNKIVLRTNLGARTYDIFGTANFFNFKPWAASVEYLLAQGIERIQSHNDKLVSRLVEGLDTEKYAFISPLEGGSRSTLVIVSHKETDRNSEVYEALKEEKIHIAFRKGNLRFAPHLYNTEEDIEQALSVLNSI